MSMFTFQVSLDPPVLGTQLERGAGMYSFPVSSSPLPSSDLDPALIDPVLLEEERVTREKAALASANAALRDVTTDFNGQHSDDDPIPTPPSPSPNAAKRKRTRKQSAPAAQTAAQTASKKRRTAADKENMIPSAKPATQKSMGKAAATSGKAAKAEPLVEGDSVMELVGKWDEDQKDLLYRSILDITDPDACARWTLMAKSPAAALTSTIKENFIGIHGLDACKGQWGRSLKTYRGIQAYLEFTGGAGDADESGSESGHDSESDGEDGEDVKDITARIRGARKAGKQIGTLTAKTFQTWERWGWYKLWDQRYAKHPANPRSKPLNSTSPVSDDEDAAQRGPEGVVSEPKHAGTPTPAKDARAAAAGTLDVVRESMVEKIKIEQVKLATYQDRLKLDRETNQARLDLDREMNEARLDLDRRRDAREEKEQVFSMAERSLKLEVDPEVKQAANGFLKSMFETAKAKLA